MKNIEMTNTNVCEWKYENCWDVGGDTCRECGRKHARFLHSLRYFDAPDPYDPATGTPGPDDMVLVCRACAEKLSGDHVSPGKNERDEIKKAMKDPLWRLHELQASIERGDFA